MNKMYDASNNHIGYAAVGYSNFVNREYDNEIECKQVDPSENCDDFHTGDRLQGATYQTIGLFDLSGKMYRCKTFNLGHFWDVIQSDDKQSLIAVGYTDNTMDQHPGDWNGHSDEYIIYNPNDMFYARATTINAARSDIVSHYLHSPFISLMIRFQRGDC